VLQPLVSELQLLEQEGIAGVAAYCGDNLELHDLGMFHRAFNGGHVCRFCTIHYNELGSSDGFIRHKLWDEETYDSIASALENGEDVESFSLRGRCVLNELESFHAARSLAPDLLHDFFEGGMLNPLLPISVCLNTVFYSTTKEFSLLNGLLQNYNI
jgi:hypothetical protein